MSLLETYKQQIRTNPNVKKSLDRDEWRYTKYGLLQSAKEMSESENSILTPELKEKAKMSEGTALSVPVFKMDGDVTITGTRSCTIGDLENTTEQVDVLWTTLVANLSMKKAQYYKNEVDYLFDLNKKLTRIDNAFAKAFEDLIYAKLDTEKSGVYNSPLVGTEYPLVGNAIQVAPAQRDFFFNNLPVIMEGDDFYGNPYKVLGNTTLKSPVNQYINQGGGNAVNTQYQFENFDFRFSNGNVIGPGLFSSGFCMPDGTLGLMTRLNADSIQENEATDGTKWSKTFFETLGFEVATTYKSACEDLSGEPGLEHLTASMVERWQFSIDLSLLTPYNSDALTKAGAIKKFEFS